MRLEPCFDRVLLVPDPSEEKKGKIILPEAAQRATTRGKVVSVGPGKRQDSGLYEKMAVEVGDYVVYSKFAGEDIEIDGVKFVVVTEAEIIGILRK